MGSGIEVLSTVTTNDFHMRRIFTILLKFHLKQALNEKLLETNDKVCPSDIPEQKSSQKSPKWQELQENMR
jgi:hypothetical protein